MHPLPRRAFSLTWARCQTVVPGPSTARASTSAVRSTRGVSTMILRSPGCGSSAEGKPTGTVTRPLTMGGKHMADGRSRPSKPPGGDSEQPASPLRVRWRGIEGSRRMILIVSAVCLCVVVAGVGIALVSSPGGQAGHVAATSSTSPATTTQPARPASPAASSRATTGAKVKSEGAIPLGWPPRLNRQILRWRAGPGGKALAGVEQQMGTAMQAAGIKLYAPMKTACAGLDSEIGTAQAAPPIPYGAMQRLYAKALTGLSNAAADCRSAISEHPGDETVDIHVNQALLNQSRLEFAAMSKKLSRATAQIQSAH